MPRARYLPATVLVVALFFLWGMANNLNDILIAQFRKAFTLSDFETSFVQQAFYLGYFCLAMPAAMVVRAQGYKTAIVLGLLLYAAGAMLFYPAAHYGEYRYFLVALFVIASGLAFLETSANPLMTELGDAAGGAKRLNWAQAANPLGTLTGVLIGKLFILSQIAHDDTTLATMAPAARTAYYRTEIQAVQTPYLVIGLVVLALAVAAALIRFPERSDAADSDAGKARFAEAFRRPALLFAAVAQFFYVGAQVGLWSYTIRYAQANLPGMIERTAADYLFASLVLFGIGRLIGSMLMTWIAPARLLAGFAAASAVLAVGAALTGGMTGLLLLVAVSFFMSIQFPTIFALGIERLGPLRRTGAALLVMAIIGGAAISAAIGAVSDRAGINTAMLVPAASFLVVLAYGYRAMRAGKAAPALAGDAVDPAMRYEV